jgi:hypothetical protein
VSGPGLRRRRWHSPTDGTTAPLDAWLETIESSISLGVREMACRLNSADKNFDKAAANLASTAQVPLSGAARRLRLNLAATLGVAYGSAS